MKEFVKSYLFNKGITLEDSGAIEYDAADDYPTLAFKLAKSIAAGTFNRGILLCGTGIGASIAANRVKGVRAALCTSPEMAHMSRVHNDSNVLVIGGRTTTKETVAQMIDAWLSGTFEGGRHQNRIDLLDA
jgi:RpiB/LacA/LacB family sugar-phosphate isomerase